MANSSRLFNSLRIRAILYFSFSKWNQFFLRERHTDDRMYEFSVQTGFYSKWREEHWILSQALIPHTILLFRKKRKYFCKRMLSLVSDPSVLITTTMNIKHLLYWHSYSQDMMFWIEWRALGAYRIALRCYH